MNGHGWWIAAALLGLALSCSATDSKKNDGSVGTGATDGGAGAGAGGSGNIGGTGGGDAGPAETVTVFGPGADSSAPTKFGGPEAPNSSVIAYPADGVVLPGNLNSLEIHFTPPSGHTLFEIRFESPSIALVVYTGCTPVGAGCAYATDQVFWDQLAKKNRGADPVTYRIRSVNGSAPAAVGSSETRTLAFGKEDIVGGLYYWNSNGFIQRYDFGYPLQQPELFMSPQMAGALTCVGCHGLSRDGKTMVIGQDIPAPAPFKVWDVATRKQVVVNSQPVSGQANFFSFSPDGKKLLFSNGIKVNLLDLTTGQIEPGDVVPQGTMPDWSPDGKKIIYAKPATPPPFGVPIPGVSSASIEIIDVLPGGGYSQPELLVQYQGQNNYYPAFAPTQNWVVFNRSPANTESFSNAPPAGDGELWAVGTDTGQQVKMTTASADGSTSWPKWAPDVNTYYDGTILWLTFSSGRPYGLRLPGGQVQLWMVGFDPARAAAGQDPSLAPFWFPYQDMGSGNHIAQWVTEIARQPCVDDSTCANGEKCENGKCVPIIK